MPELRAQAILDRSQSQKRLSGGSETGAGA